MQANRYSASLEKHIKQWLFGYQNESDFGRKSQTYYHSASNFTENRSFHSAPIVLGQNETREIEEDDEEEVEIMLNQGIVSLYSYSYTRIPTPAARKV